MGKETSNSPGSDRDVCEIIRYLDPDSQNRNSKLPQNQGFESVLMLILLLGGVIACVVALLVHVRE